MIARLIPFIAIFAAIGFFFGYINPTFSGSIVKTKAEIKGYDAALSAARRFKAKEAELVSERNNIDPAGLERINRFLPDGVDNVQLILDLNALAVRSGMKLSDFDIEPFEPNTENTSSGALSLSVAEEPVESLTLSVSALGTYQAFRSFLSGTEQSLRPLDLTELSVQDSTTGVYAYSLTYRIYWLR
jgi:Tfp pilus assembly protein PilO